MRDVAAREGELAREVLDEAVGLGDGAVVALADEDDHVVVPGLGPDDVAGEAVEDGGGVGVEDAEGVRGGADEGVEVAEAGERQDELEDDLGGEGLEEGGGEVAGGFGALEETVFERHCEVGVGLER